MLNPIESIDKKTEQVADKLAIAYFMWVGGVAGIAWSAVVNTFDYFDSKFPEHDIKFVFPLAPNVAQIITTLVITHLSNVLSYSARIIISLVILLMLALFIPFEADLFKETDFGMYLIMALLFILGFFNTLCYASVAGLTSKIEGKYTAFFLIGVAIFGLVMNLFREVTLLIFLPETDDDIVCVLAYFAITALLILGGLVLHGLFLRSNFYKLRCCKDKGNRIIDQDIEASLIGSEVPKRRPQKSLRTLIEVSKETKFYLFLILLACIQQNIPYPGVMLKKPIDGMPNHTKTLTMITTFSLFYIFGKKLGQYREYYNEVPVIITLLVRFALMGFFVIQAVTVDILVFNTIWFGYLNVALFAITMGFLNVSLFILTPEKVQGEKKELAGFLAVFAINFGCMIGSFLSLTLKDIGPCTCVKKFQYGLKLMSSE